MLSDHKHDTLAGRWCRSSMGWFFQGEDGIRDDVVTGVQTCALPICVATLFMSLAALAFVIFPNTLMAWLWPLGIFFGLGYGAYSSVDWALSIDVLPCMEKAGKDLGVWNASGTLPAIPAPILGSVIINMAAAAGQTVVGYQLVFGTPAFFFLLPAVAILLAPNSSN